MGAHDHLFKELLRTCFEPLLAAFLPDLHRQLQPGSAVFVNKEHLAPRGPRLAGRVVDLVAQVRLRDTPSLIVILVEHQSRRDPGMPYRMFQYTAGLLDQFRLPVYPVLITSYDQPRNPEPGFLEIITAGRPVLRFDFHVIQLNRIPWREFIGRDNPAVAALMARMDIPVADRPRAKVEILRMLVRLRMERDQQRVIAGFVDQYLLLTEQELLAFQRELDQVDAPEKDDVMELMTSWERKGLEAGLAQGRLEGRSAGRSEGRVELVQRLLRRRLGKLPESLKQQVAGLSFATVGRLGTDLLDFESVEDLQRWLDTRNRPRRNESSDGGAETPRG